MKANIPPRPLSGKEAQIILEVVGGHLDSFFVFGSRTKNKNKQYSDLDLCYLDDISDLTISQLAEKFEQSDLPFKVDFVAWKRCSPEFQQLIANDLVKLETFLNKFLL